MAKVEPCTSMVSGFFYWAGFEHCTALTLRKSISPDSTKKGGERPLKDVIAYRKTCTAEGVGLSHYILVAAKTK